MSKTSIEREVRHCTECGHRADHHHEFGVGPCGMCDCIGLRLPNAVKPRPMDTSAKAFLRDCREAEKHLREAVHQCEMFRVNGEGDEIRWFFVAPSLRKAQDAVERWKRREAATRVEATAPDEVGR